MYGKAPLPEQRAFYRGSTGFFFLLPLGNLKFGSGQSILGQYFFKGGNIRCDIEYILFIKAVEQIGKGKVNGVQNMENLYLCILDF